MSEELVVDVYRGGDDANSVYAAVHNTSACRDIFGPEA